MAWEERIYLKYEIRKHDKKKKKTLGELTNFLPFL